ncbi:MAG: SIS domain-containing protein [Candidatus Aegiribacteria sp.]|nr:SIS domain-containing protein [Candidatus Aegiribacteria sp.]
MTEIEKYIKAAKASIASLNCEMIEKASDICVESVLSGGTIFFCGNGGSAADAQHLAGELVGRFRLERDAIPAIAITANAAVVTAIANDYDFSEIFARQLEALGKPGDVLIAISTSGRSRNVIKAVEEARQKSMKIIGFTGNDGGEIAEKADVAVKAFSNETSHIQEELLIAGHAICSAVEKAYARSSGSGR